MRARRRCRSAESLAENSRAVEAQVLGLPELRTAHRLVLYAALPDEVSTRSIFAAAASAGLPCLLPRVRADGGLAFARVDRWEDLRPGRYGVLEPSPEARAEPLAAGDLVLVPGVAFDAQGRRLGRGGGYFDRALGAESRGGALLVGLAFEDQMVEEVPTGPRDRAVHLVVTECRALRVNAGGQHP